VALVNDFEVIVRGIEAMLAEFRDEVRVTELDVGENPDQRVDIALFDTYGHGRGGVERVQSLVAEPDIGAVGARLLYPDGTIQHAGVFTGIGGGAGHAHRFVGGGEEGYFERARLPQRVSAVTGACMVVARDKFLAVGGFNEEHFPVAFNDVDLCLKLNRAGWQSFYEPRSTLIHHESKSRGSDRLRINRARFAGELAALKAVWHTDQFRDPYHHPHLSPFCEQFLVGV